MSNTNKNNHEEAENMSQDPQIDSETPVETDDSSELVNDGQQELQAQVNEWKDKYLRLVAEFDNYKKRTSKERIELIQTAGTEVISSLLDVMDDSERAEKQMNESQDIQQIKEGISLVFAKMRSTLTNKGLKAFESIGKDFDVELHEAIAEIPAPDPSMEGKILDEVQKGYYLNDKLLRHAKVVVGK